MQHKTTSQGFHNFCYQIFNTSIGVFYSYANIYAYMNKKSSFFPLVGDLALSYKTNINYQDY